MVTMSIMLSPSGSSRLTPNHPSTAPPAARRSCWVDSRRRWPSPGRDRGRRAPPGARRPCRQVTRSVLFKWTRSHRADPGQGPRSRLVGTAPPFRRTEARAQRTLERLSPEQPQPGSVGQLLRPRSRALGGKSGMTRAEPLVFRYGGSKGNHSPWPHNVRNCSQPAAPAA